MIIQLIAALLPPILLWLYICLKDPRPEPVSQLLKAVLYGMLVSIPIVLVEAVYEAALANIGLTSATVVGTTAQAFLVAAIPEETFKLLALWLILRKNPYFDEHFDGIVYAVCIGLGFAAVENVFYIIAAEDWVTVAIARSLMAVPGHYAFAILMGYYYSRYHFVDSSQKTAVCILLVPFLAHGIYDALAMSGLVDPTIGGVCFLILIYFCVKLHKKAKSKIIAQIERDNAERNFPSEG